MEHLEQPPGIEYLLTKVAVALKTVIYYALVLTRGVHHQFPVLYTIITYTLGAYVCYKMLIYILRSLYTTVKWILRMFIILYVIYMVLCVASTVEKIAVADKATDIDMETLVSAIVTTVSTESTRLWSLARVGYSGMTIFVKHMLLPALSKATTSSAIERDPLLNLLKDNADADDMWSWKDPQDLVGRLVNFIH